MVFAVFTKDSSEISMSRSSRLVTRDMEIFKPPVSPHPRFECGSCRKTPIVCQGEGHDTESTQNGSALTNRREVSGHGFPSRMQRPSISQFVINSQHLVKGLIPLHKYRACPEQCVVGLIRPVKLCLWLLQS